MAELPAGNVTFLFTDVEGSTRLLERDPALAGWALQRHHELLRQNVEANAGCVFETVGDAVYAAFARPSDALAAACQAQLALQAEEWGQAGPIRVRMGLHTGEVERRGKHYFGPALFRCARLMAAAHGGQVLLSGVTASLVADHQPAEISLRDMGLHRLKDLSEPEHVWQLVQPELPSEFPALRLAGEHPNNLPHQLTSFIGRETELPEAMRLLDGTRLLTLTGAGGSGKTRLALEMARRLVDGYSDGVWLVELAPLTEPGLVPQTVASALGLQEAPGEPVLTTLARFIRPKRLLLVLDNCEHLLGACAQLAGELLRFCPRLAILATSREALRVPGEIGWSVPPFPSADLAGPLSLERLAEYDAVRLFVARAAATRPGFVLTEDNSADVAQICHRLDGIPLAIELAAARVNALSPAQIAQRLDDRFRLLTGSSRIAVERQQTLRNAVEWSYALLSEAEQRLFRRLAVFAGGSTLEAVEAVCGDQLLGSSEILDLMGGLVDKSLLLADHAPGGEVRYRMLETLREYARLRLAEEAEQPVRLKHLVYYSGLVRSLDAPLYGPQQVATVGRFQEEHDNLRLMLGNAHLQPEATNLATEAAAMLCSFWFFHNDYTEARHWIGWVLSTEHGADPAWRARCLAWDAFFAASLGDHANAAMERDQAVQEGQRSNDPHALAWATFLRCASHFVQGNADAMAHDAEEALRLCGASGWAFGAALSEAWLGRALIMRLELHDGRHRLESALTWARQSGDPFSIAFASSFLAVAESAEGDYARAADSFAEAMDTFRRLGSLAHQSRCLVDWGTAALRAGSLADSSRAFAEGFNLAERWGLVPYRFAQLFFGIAQLAGAVNSPHVSAQLLSVASKLRDASKTQLPPEQQRDETSLKAHLRDELGADGFAQAWDAGQTLSEQQAAACAREALGACPTAQPMG